ncbi:MAG TPA: hypothetical protein VN881_06380 [Candidatus Acidoferrales bacterium]|nr:hypothetical protein [Candidatus Acidoferrales bacterium]
MADEDEQPKPRKLHPGAGAKIATEDLLIEQYRILESRRNYFGRLFWQLPAFIVTILTLVISRVAEKRSIELAIVLFMSALLLFLAAWIAYRLLKSQEECELLLGKLEERFRRELNLKPMSLPYSHKIGARFWTLICLVVFAIMLAGFAVEVFVETHNGGGPASVERPLF